MEQITRLTTTSFQSCRDCQYSGWNARRRFIRSSLYMCCHLYLPDDVCHSFFGTSSFFKQFNALLASSGFKSYPGSLVPHWFSGSTYFVILLRPHAIAQYADSTEVLDSQLLQLICINVTRFLDVAWSLGSGTYVILFGRRLSQKPRMCSSLS